MNAEHVAETLLRSLHHERARPCSEELPVLEAVEPHHPPTLELRAASLRRGSVRVLAPVSATLRAGHLSVILGPNGAGKSSLLALLSGEAQASSGTVWMNGECLRPGPTQAQAHARLRALLPQEGTVAFDYRVQELVELGRYPHRSQPCADEAGVVQAALQATGVAHLAQRSVQTLSGGERARAHLARVLAQIWHPPQDRAQSARWLLLDEPTAALDLGHQHEVLRLLRSWAQVQGVGVVAVLHDLNLALRYADWALVLQAGHLQAQGRPQEVLSVSKVNQVWQVQAQLIHDKVGIGQLLTA